MFSLEFWTIGLFVMQALQKQLNHIKIDVIDSQFSPFGYYERVAPDHIKIKSLQSFFNTILCADNIIHFMEMHISEKIFCCRMFPIATTLFLYVQNST